MPTAAEKPAKKSQKVPSTMFELEYNRLNEAQEQAVDTIEGPVMVVAGPGTGKTQTVSMRVANILRKTQMRPSNILCLTYSVSGATAMRERLRHLIGADAYGVTVATVHSFAKSIINDHPEVFADLGMREQLTDVDRYRELNALIDTVSSKSNLINPKDPYGKDTDLLGRISQVKREGKTLEDLEKTAGVYDREMREKSREGTKAHADNLLRAKKFRDFVEIFRLYGDMLEAKGKYDYDDLILQATKALAEHDWLLAGLQERYQYVLVDEVQDLNGAQFQLLTLLTTYNELPHEPNLFVVGDDDQSIYRFQGANIQYMMAFRDRFKKAPVIALTTSYRSTQAILDAAESLINRNEERLVGKVPGLSKHLTSSMEKGKVPELLRTPSDVSEAWAIADIVEEKITAGVPVKNIAILTRKNSELMPHYDVLRSRNIPTLLRGKIDLLSHPLVAQILAILRSIEKPIDDTALAIALACPTFRIHTSDLSRLQSIARDKEKKMKLREALLSIESGEIPLLDPAALIAARDSLSSLEQQSHLRTVLETVEAIIRECKLLPCGDEPDLSTIDPRDSAAVEAFFSFVKTRSLGQPPYTIREFFSDLAFYNDPVYGQVHLTYELPHLTAEGVSVMTAHQSKGLEFEIVILSNFRDGHWDDPQHRSAVSVPEDLLFGWDKAQKVRERHEDERRLAYVAATRAERELILVCPKELTVGEKTRTISPSAFFAEMGTLPERDIALKSPEAASLLLRPKPPLLDTAMQEYLKDRLEEFALSPTSLNRFLVDPLEFLRVDLLQQPEFLDEASIRRLGYGSGAHWALKAWATARQRDEDFTLDQFLEAFTWYLQNKTILTEKQCRDLLSMGKQSLGRYFHASLENVSPLFHALEKDYRARIADKDGDIPLKGKIDRIDLLSLTSATATVIDYKTGSAKSELVIRGGLEPGSVSRTDDGANFRQLVFYALLLEKADPLLKPESFVLEFLGEREQEGVRRSFTVTEAEKKDLTSLIKEVWAKITALDFSPF